MKIASFNVNGINGRLPVLLQWLEETGPDVVCLQELKAPNEKFPWKDLLAAGYNSLWHGQKQWNGVAILTRNLEINEVGRGLQGNPQDHQSRYLEALIEDVLVCCLYLPNGNPYPGPKFNYKLDWLKRFTARTEELLALDTPVILAGDFNVIPTPMDVYKPEKWKDDALFLPVIRSAYQELLDNGWTDALRELYPGERIYTFWDYFRNAYERDAGLRLDHFLLSPQLKKHLTDGGVDRQVRGWEKASDHAPVWIKLEN